MPWYIWLCVAGVTSASTGLAWDVSWHRSIGRDTFWTPAHGMVYLCGVLAAITGIYLVFACTFLRTSPLRASSVRVFGLRAPLGVFVSGWGGIAMLTAAPFDDWWHGAYGVDVKIISPPHALLILGIRSVALGAYLLILAAMNRAHEDRSGSFPTLQRLLLYLGGLMIVGQMFFLQEYTWDVLLHRSTVYKVLAVGIPVVFAIISQASRYRWAATVVAAIYTAFLVGEILLFPLIPAEPRLGPVFTQVTHLIPTKFPILLVAPGFALDLLWQRTRSWRTWQVAAVSGLVFVAVLFAVEWPMASFLLSRASENRFFGTQYFDYSTRPESFDRLRLFSQPQHGLELLSGLARACVAGAVSTWAGLAIGRWMRGVQR